jgi:hypothetical protein
LITAKPRAISGATFGDSTRDSPASVSGFDATNVISESSTASSKRASRCSTSSVWPYQRCGAIAPHNRSAVSSVTHSS